MKPSDFLKKGFPNCSIFGETWHEMTAVTYLQALIVKGDTWDRLTPDEIRDAIKEVPHENLEPGISSVLHDTERLEKIAGVLTSAEDAKNFSWVWNR